MIKMDDNIIVALISSIGTLLGSLFGILASARLTNWRIAQLEEKVNKHNNVLERVYKLERYNAVQDEKIKNLEQGVHIYEKN